VAGLLLMYLPERHAFGGLVVLMQDRGLRRYYSTDMSLLQVRCSLMALFVSCILSWECWVNSAAKWCLQAIGLLRHYACRCCRCAACMWPAMLQLLATWLQRSSKLAGK
jgi:hypothetical protein